MRILRAKKPAHGLDMTPLIDCVFQLLIFFMLTWSFTAAVPVMDLALPKAASGTEKPPAGIVVTVDAAGTLRVGTEAVEAGLLEARLREALAASADKVVTFRGDARMPYETFVLAMDAARRAGASNVRIAHDRSGRKGPDGR